MIANDDASPTDEERGASGETKRRARKRETDRRAQREHRQRHKAYVRQLEEVVRDLTAQHSRDDRIIALQAEKARLQGCYNSLKGKLDRIRLVAQVDDSASLGSKNCEHDINGNQCKTLPSTPSSMVHIDEDGEKPDDAVEPPLVNPQPLGQKISSLETFANEMPFDLDTIEIGYPPFSEDGQNSHPEYWINKNFNLEELPAYDSLSNLNHITPVPDFILDSGDSQSDHPPPVSSGDVAQISDDVEFCVQPSAVFLQGENRRRIKYTNLDLDTYDPPDLLTAMQEEREGPEPDLSLKSISASQSLLKNAKSVCFPRYGPSKCHADMQVLSMVEEARREHQLGRFDLSRPTLRRLISNLPVDCLSFRLFHYINGYGPVPLQNFLAIFWVQYLFLRWHVLGTIEAFEEVPDFLRPTPLECLMPHQPFIGMLVWPMLRQTLIRDSEKVDLEAIGMELMKNLDLKWSRNTSGETGLEPGSMDVIEMIDRQARIVDFWVVRPGFFTQYPQYAGCF